MITVRIITVRYFEDDIIDGESGEIIGEPDYANPYADEIHECEDWGQAADLIANRGLSFRATGTDWAADPDGSQIIDYVKAEREEVSAHVEGATVEEMDAIMDSVDRPAMTLRHGGLYYA